MNDRHLVLIAAALLAAPLAYAHDTGEAGVPKTYCEDTVGDTRVHEYEPPANGVVVGLADDGAVGSCGYDDQWDGHYEFAPGGAWLLACETACATYGSNCVSPGSKCRPGDGAILCWETYADHPENPHIWVVDDVLTTEGFPVTFTVGADHWYNVPDPDPAAPICGDFLTDYTQDCVDDCLVQFAPGKDGSYQVFVSGTHGHVFEGASPPPECSDRVDNDNDGRVDGFRGLPSAPWGLTDSQCGSAYDNSESV